MTTVLCMHHQPDAISGILEERFPALDVHYAATNAEISERLSSIAPEVVFSIKGPEFPGNEHRRVLDCPEVKWVQVGGSGYEHMQPYDAGRIAMTNCAGLLARHLAQTVTGAMIAMNGHFFTYRDQQRRAEWTPRAFEPLEGQRLLVVGLGQIGTWVAHNAKALGMQVDAVRRGSEKPDVVDQLFTPDVLHEALSLADVVSVHVRATPETQHLFAADTFAAMKRGAYFINTSRGMVVDTAALIDALDQGHLAGAYLDVFEEEPLPGDHPIWARDNVFVMPHASDNIHAWDRRFTEFFADNMERWLAGKPLLNRVDG
ncbi:MAG: D-2-hydroxyacid dehydrogenase [Pseudomonadota bacterium]